MSFYVIANSNQSLNLFPGNSPFHFRLHLNTPLILDGVWKVGLSEVYIQDNPVWTDHHLYIYCSVCDKSVIDGDSRALLRRLMPNENGLWKHIFNPTFYLTVSKSQINNIEFSIKTDTNKFASFLTQPVTLTLHFKHYPFFS